MYIPTECLIIYNHTLALSTVRRQTAVKAKLMTSCRKGCLNVSQSCRMKISAVVVGIDFNAPPDTI